MTLSLSVVATVDVEWDKITNAIVGFCEGGCSGWASGFHYRESSPSKDLAAAARGTDAVVWYADPRFWVGGGLADLDHDAPVEDGPTKTMIGQGEIAKGLQIMAAKEPRHFADLVTENDDAITHDVLLQCIVFGEIIYG